MTQRRYDILKSSIKQKDLEESDVYVDRGGGYYYGYILKYVNTSLNLPEGTITKIVVY